MADPASLEARITPQELRILTPACQMSAARFSPCGKLLIATGHDGRLHRWETAALELPVAEPAADGKPQPKPKPEAVPQPESLAPLEGHRGWVTALAFSAATERFVSGDSWGRLCCWPSTLDATQPLWNLETAHDGWLRDMAVSSDGTRVATCGRDQAVRVWSVSDGTLEREFKGHGQDVYSVRFHPDGQSLVSGDVTGVVRQWNLATGEPVRDFNAKALFTLNRLQDVGGARVLRFSPDGSRLAVAGTQPKNGGNVQGIPTVLLFDWATGELRETLVLGAEGDVYVTDLDFHPDGFLLAVLSGNPGTGKFLLRRDGETTPFYATTHMANCHSLSQHPAGVRLAVTATNRGSNGNGRQLGPNGEYVGNHSPIHLFDWPTATT